jgi:DNA-binding MarR family transcriptional regulator
MHTREGTAITELILAIFLTNGRIIRAGDTLLRDLGLTGARWQVLGSIKDTPKTVAQIARKYELSRQGVLWLVRSLLEDGLVEYIDNPDHKRSKLLVFTEQGRRTYNEIERRQHLWSNEIGSAFSLDEIQSATQCVRHLGELIKGRDGDDDE